MGAATGGGALMTGAEVVTGAGAGRSMASIDGCGADSLRAGDLAAC